MTAPPGLLVSVRDADEAAAAIRGGCDWLDIKDPAKGSLGYAGFEACETILAVRNQLAPQLPISAALGELSEWNDSLPRIPHGIATLKVGLAELAPGWRERFAEFRSQMQIEHDRKFSWVMVCYVDRNVARFSELLELAGEIESRFFLFDTFDKTRRRAPAALSSLAELSEQVSATGLQPVWAGQLDAGMIAAWRGPWPAMIAVRSAVCIDSNRRQPVHQQRVVDFRRCLHGRLLPS